MNTSDRTEHRKSKHSRVFLTSLVIIVILVIIAVVTPLSIILPRKKHSEELKSAVLVPLYMYPVPGAWNPLYDALAAQPHLDFTVILNPDSGPGSSAYPSDDYSHQIQKLNTYTNVQTVGYVRTGYATRNISSVLLDVATYSGWATGSSVDSNETGLALDGIFFDEVPSVYSETTAEYLKTINQAVKNATGLLSGKMIIHNPGIIPDARLLESNTDLTVVFEGSYEEYEPLQKALQSLPNNRSQYSYVIHSLPVDLIGADLKNFVDGLSQHAEFLFTTNLNQSYYESFGSNWRDFVDAMPL